jgi:hypothetical protein
MQPTPISLLVSFLLSGNRVVHDKIRLNENGEYELLPSMGAAAESTQPSFKSLPDLVDYYLANGERAGLGYSLIDSNPIYDNHQLIQERTGALVKKSFEQEPAVAPKRTIYDENPIRSDGAMANATFVDPPPPPSLTDRPFVLRTPVAHHLHSLFIFSFTDSPTAASACAHTRPTPFLFAHSLTPSSAHTHTCTTNRYTAESSLPRDDGYLNVGERDDGADFD